MNLMVEQAQGRVPVTIIGLTGDLDGSNYDQLITKAQDLYRAGARHVLIDMSGVPYMSSAGLVALHSISRLLRGEPLLDTSTGWAAYRTIRNETVDEAPRSNLKLVGVQERVAKVLELAGMTTVFESHTDREQAIASFA